LLLFGDFTVGLIALVLSLYFWASGDQWLPFSWEFLSDRPPAWFYLLPIIWIILLVDIYEERNAASWRHTLRTVATAALFGLGLYLLLYFFYTTPKSLPRRGIAGFVLSASVLTLVWRWTYIRIFTATQFLRRVLLVGAGETGQTILQITKDIQPPPFYWIGIIDDDPKKIGTEIEGLMTFGGSSVLLEVVARESVSEIIVAISGEMRGSMFQALLDAQEKGVSITRMPVAYEELLGRVPVRHLEADWILRSFVDEARVSGFYELGKRIFDIIIALVGFAVFVVTLPFIGLTILLDSGGPIFYTQMRCGRGALLYRIIKFRTMSKDAEPNGRPQWAEENDKRATRVGRFLRKTHLDELPQIINVLAGDMSIVGPRAERPELVAWFQQHVPFYRARLLVKPGITGWAQINYGYASTIDETMTKMEYDLYYIKHRNLILDFIILIRTPSMVWGLRGR
jgi:exopolysaccharide biosynthesis polyprenyl glycosylphosphotransferase